MTTRWLIFAYVALAVWAAVQMCRLRQERYELHVLPPRPEGADYSRVVRLDRWDGVWADGNPKYGGY
jgi:hypothetical protein